MTIVLDIPRILIEICLKVQSQVGSLIGTEEANESYGLGAGGDISKKIDIVAEHVVIDVLKNYGLKSIIVAEESGKVNITDGKNEGYIVVDALDGTTNALRGISFYCCSIACRSISPASLVNRIILSMHSMPFSFHMPCIITSSGLSPPAGVVPPGPGPPGPRASCA